MARRSTCFVPLVLLGAVAVALVAAPHAAAQTSGRSAAAFETGTLPEAVATIAIHPITAADVVCSEHSAHVGDPVILGDAAGRDCTVVRRDAGPAGKFARTYAGDGAKNEDWFGWGAPLLAPFDGVVVSVRLNPAMNQPGARGEGPASAIVFERADGVRVVYGHIRDPLVAAGDTVTAGQPVAAIGNNGFGWFPHTHIGAWKGSEALQVTFDPWAAGRVKEAEHRKRQAQQGAPR
jgi:hypothetical protein